MTPLRYMGDGTFKAVYPDKVDQEPGTVAAWEKVEARSKRSHDHFFAVVADAWANLPEDLAGEFPTAEHLRKWALCKTGYCDISKIICQSASDALTAQQTIAALDGFSIAEVFGPVLTVYRPHSQSVKAMGRQKFQESKDAVLSAISELIGADATEAGKAA